MKLNFPSRKMTWLLMIIVALGFALVFFRIANFRHDWNLRQSNTSYHYPMGEANNYLPCSDVPEGLKAVWDHFPDYDGRQYCADSDAGVPGLVNVWRIDGATKEMFEFASADNQLVGKGVSEIDKGFWDVPLPWWTPSHSNHTQFAATPGIEDGSTEGGYTAVMFDSENKELYCLAIFNL
jgi:hypothetical protein